MSEAPEVEVEDQDPPDEPVQYLTQEPPGHLQDSSLRDE